MAKHVLITGGVGFIGRHLCNELLESGYEVRVLDGFLDQVHSRAAAVAHLTDVEVVVGDIRDADAVRVALGGMDAVVHLAAEVGVGQSMYEIARYVGTNDLGTAVLLQELIAHPIERLVVASSMSVYGEGLYRASDGRLVETARRDPASIAAGRFDITDADGGVLDPVPTDESKPVDLASIYALTKYAQEKAALLFGQAYRIDSVALRLFNVFGPGQALANPYTGVLANFASRLAIDERPTIFEDGFQRRDFVHVRDVARAFRLALERPQVGGNVINVGSGRSYTVRDVASLLARAMDRPIEPEILGRARTGDIRNCFSDIGKAEALLGFRPMFAMEDTLGELADWVAAQQRVDNNATMRRELEIRGLVS
ncbi:NAD-dependent epimerase/dehydratase family protein [Marinivivus vitaminiproducens]|uniref:NAD-dependent epimerase/dehydratase family protein n=1 Tax=Marinivivus vitaminiproducens TaxID=3035935 RepID=UPI0027A4F40C|nr:SDR family NAD(P)-dependent oxidoreductase [Geminicoccaceae bacterium SCSIO 64248]